MTDQGTTVDKNATDDADRTANVSTAVESDGGGTVEVPDAGNRATETGVSAPEGARPADSQAARTTGEPVRTPKAKPADLPAHKDTPPTPVSNVPVEPALTNPTRWGQVDENGTVHLITGAGRREVGSWQAGAADEGLAHFARRFDDILTEVQLLEARLESGAGDPKQAMTSAKSILDSIADAKVVGDVDGLSAKLRYLIGQAEAGVARLRQAKEATKAEAIARKTALADEAETLANESTQWKVAGDRLRTILEEWKTIRGIDRKTDELLWKRFSKARDAFNRRRGSHFAELDRQRAGAKARKQEIVTEAESLADSTDWAATAARYKVLMTEWKAAGRAPKDVDDSLWQQFRAAQDRFFANRSAAYDERDAEFVANARQKEALLAEAERIDTGNLNAAKAALSRIHERWEQIGKVPRERIRELDGRLRAVEDRIREASEAQWRRGDPEAEARVAQFRDRVNQFEAQAAKARAAGDEKRARKADEQAAQWREWLAAAEAAVATR